MKRVEALKFEMNRLKFDCYVCGLDSNIRYLTSNSKTSFEGLTLLVLKDSKPIIYTSKLEEERIKKEVKNVEVEVLKEEEKIEDRISEKVLENKIKKMFFDSLTFNQFKIFHKKLPETKIECKPEILLRLREVKDNHEIELMKKAAKISDKAMKTALEFLRVGVKEYEVAAEAEYVIRKMGCEGLAFKTIVASGFRSAFPHGNSTEKTIRNGDAVVLDIGAKYMGYNSNLTRTIFVGKPSPSQLRVYRIVYKLQLEAFKKIKSNMEGWEADNLVRKKMEKESLAEYFIHGLGHGIGLDVHELPRLSKKSKDKLKKMSVVTVEPGIYLPGKFGVRIEDTTLVSEDGLKPLTRREKTIY